MVNEMDVGTLLRWKLAVELRHKNELESGFLAMAVQPELKTHFIRVMVNDLDEGSFKKWKTTIELRILRARKLTYSNAER